MSREICSSCLTELWEHDRMSSALGERGPYDWFAM